MGVVSNASLTGTQRQHRHLLVHRNAANPATENITQDAHLKIIHMTGRSKNKKQHAIGCEKNHTVVNGGQLAV